LSTFDVGTVGVVRSGASRSSSPAIPTSVNKAYRLRHTAATGEFIDENGGGPGVRLRKRHQKKS
jgi:hypothetical protein